MSGHHISNDDREQHMRNFQKQTGDHQFTQEELVAASPVTIPQLPEQMFQTFLTNLFKPQDCVELKAAKLNAGGDKAGPTGISVKLTVKEWCDHSANGTLDGVLPGNLGTFIRINPIIPGVPGHGYKGETTGEDIARWPYCLIEHDDLPIPEQVRLLASLRLPLAAIVHTGGKSLHAWLKVDQDDWLKYKEAVGRLYSRLNYFGFDRANKDAARLARAPGFRREAKPDSPGWQKLLYLNPAPTGASILDQIKELNSSSAK